MYAVLHDPVYKKKYAINLRRDFPRIPFQLDFWKWADWGERLIELHVGYDSIKPHPLVRADTPDARAAGAKLSPRVILKVDQPGGRIILDSETILSGVPPAAWEYKLGNRSALEWVLDQYKEKAPKDPTIRAKFNAYRFADYKEAVVDLLARVTTVSVETAQIESEMQRVARDPS